MRRSALLGLGIRTLMGLEEWSALLGTILAASLKAKRVIAFGLLFSGFTFVLQYAFYGLPGAMKYALRVYSLVVTFGGTFYDLPPEEMLSIGSWLRLPRSMTLIAFLSQSYFYRLISMSIDARLVVDWKYRGFLRKLYGRLIGVLNVILEESGALAEVIELYLKTPIKPPKSYYKDLVTLVVTVLIGFFFLSYLSVLLPSVA